MSENTSVITVKHLSDSEVIHKILNGETALFEILIRRNNGSLYKVGRAYGYNHQDTQDLMQETYLEASFVTIAQPRSIEDLGH